MSTYVMSDIHGCYTAFQKMLEKIEFSDNDELIVAGDIVDRGPENYEMLKWFEELPENVTVLMGNHDDEFAYNCNIFALCMRDNQSRSKIEYYVHHPLSSLVDLDRYGTLRDLIKDHECDEEDFARWAKMIKNLPYYKKLEINDKKYIVVHAGYLDEDSKATRKILRKYNYRDIYQFYIWARDDALSIGGIEDTTTVFGHTPTIASSAYYTGGTVYISETMENGSRFINLDCGYVYKEKNPGANMAAIRLDDEKIFYLDEINVDSNLDEQEE